MRTIALVLPLILMVPVSGAQVQWMVLTANKASTCSVQAHPGEQVLGCYSLDTEVLQSLASGARKGGSLEVPHPSGSFEVVEWEAETYENGAVSEHGRPVGQPHATFQLTALCRTAIGEYQLEDRFYELRPLREGGAVLLEVDRSKRAISGPDMVEPNAEILQPETVRDTGKTVVSGSRMTSRSNQRCSTVAVT